MNDNITDISGQKRSVKEMLESVDALRSGAGGGNSGGMEPRIAKLEAGVVHILADLSTLKGDVSNARERLAALEVKVDHLPSKGFIVTVVVLGLAVVTGLIGYTEQIQSLVGTK